MTIDGTTRPELDQDLHIDGDMVLGSRVIDQHLVQAPRSFSVASGLEPTAAPRGLTTDFYPHYDIEAQIPLDDDGEPVDDLPHTVLPGPGSKTISQTSTWELFEGSSRMCPEQERAPKPPAGQFPPPPIVYSPTEWILCDVRYGVTAEATIVEDGGEAAAYNIVGQNVAPSFSTTVTSDLAITDGYVVSTAGDNHISAAFPLQTEFGFRSFGFLQVPETGTYRFGTQSPGGAELRIYDTTETDLGEMQASHLDAWRPTTVGEHYEASTDEWRFANRETGTSSRQDPAYYYRTRHYEHAGDDTDWFQVSRGHLRGLLDDLRDSGPRGDHLRWGQPLVLAAGRTYPIAFTGWVGAVGGEIGIHVDGPTGGTVPLPFDWLSAAPSGTTGFTREFDASAVTALDGVALALSGYGDTLAVLRHDGSLEVHETDGGVGWRPVATIPDLGFTMPKDVATASGAWGMAFDDEGNTLAVALDRWPGSQASATLRNHDPGMLHGDLRGEASGSSGDLVLREHGRQVVLDAPVWIDIFVIDMPFWTGRVHLDALEFILGDDGSLLSGSIDGSLEHTSDDGGTWPIDAVEASVDPDTGDPVLMFATVVDDETMSWGIGFDETHVEVLVPDGQPSPFEVAVVEKRNLGQPWSSDNVDITYLNDLLDSSGHGLPWIADEDDPVGSRYALTSFGQTHDTPALAVEDEAVALSHPAAFDLGVVGHPLWGAPSAASLHIDTLVLDRAGPQLVGGAVEGRFEVATSNGSHVYDLDLVLDGSVDPASEAVSVWLEVSSFGIHRGEVELVFEQRWIDHPVVDVVQVHLVPGGDTVTVVQPVGDHYRVVVVDRSGSNGAWSVVGELPLEPDADLAGRFGGAPVAVGRDGDVRFVATASGSNVEIRQWTPTSGWAEPVVLAVDTDVTSLAVDYFAEHLAIGQGGGGRVSVYERPWWSSDWTPQTELAGPDGFGAQLHYAWGLLTVADPGEALVRVYKDTGSQPWSSYSDWSQTLPEPAGPAIMFGTGGDPTRFRNVAVAVPLGGAFDGLPTGVS